MKEFLKVITGADQLEAEKSSADYLTLSPVFKPLSKSTETSPLGIEPLAEAAQACKIPVFALGGISSLNAAQCLSAGAVGVAVIGAVFGNDQPPEAVKRILTACRHGAGG